MPTILAPADLQRVGGGTRHAERQAGEETPIRPTNLPKMTFEEYMEYVGGLLEPLPW